MAMAWYKNLIKILCCHSSELCGRTIFSFQKFVKKNRQQISKEDTKKDAPLSNNKSKILGKMMFTYVSFNKYARRYFLLQYYFVNSFWYF